MTDSKIRYCRTSDGVAIAYTTVGEGPPLLYVRRFLAPGVDDELVFSFSQWGALTPVRSVVLWDMRGSGLSEGAPGTSFDDWMRDMQAVADAVAQAHHVERADLCGEMTPSHFAIAYAARHPDRVGKIVLWNPTPAGFSPRARQPDWMRELASKDWDSFADMSSLRMYGWPRAEAAARFAERLRQHFTYESYERTMDAIESIGAGEEAADVQAPTLVIADQNFFIERGAEETFEVRHGFMRWLVAEMQAAEFAIVKPGDPDEGGRIAVRFLEPSYEAPHQSADAGGTAIILFADIVGSTALTERLGDAGFRERARSLDDSLRGIVRGRGGVAIEGKLVGDGILATFSSASEAIAAAMECSSAAGSTQLQLHMGLHAGDVIREADNVFGGAVNLASRISALSSPGEVLVSRTVADLARTSAGVTFEDRGEHALKGIAEPQHVFAVRVAPGG